MDIYLIRHADAVEETLDLPDPSRHLSAPGRGHARTLGERLRWHDCTPIAVWTSPLVRAVQTGELVAAALNYAGDIVAQPELAPGGNLHAIETALAALAPTASVLVIGHEPGLSALGGLLVRSAEFAAVRKAEAVRISDGAVRWRFAHDDEAPRLVR